MKGYDKRRGGSAMSNERRRSGSRSGFTIIELLVTTAIFIVLLAAVGSLLLSGTRAYTLSAERSGAIQDSEAVLQLLRHEVALAGFRGLGETTYDQAFTLGSGQESIRIHRTATGDEVSVRYFETQYLGPDDEGERSVKFYVNTTTDTLVREAIRSTTTGTSSTSTELLVGNVTNLTVLNVLDRNRTPFTVDDILLDPTVAPSDVAGLTMTVVFADGSDWQFLVGTSNPQSYTVTSE